ncbi:MAG: alpha-xylosidase, partial [Oscillospiraceae bacterium]|nr:alpha-xylosidase [Oscillospiraceae bacterium]
MKFSDGMWMTRQGFSVSSPAEAYDSRVERHGVTVWGPYAPVRERGSTLNLGQLTLTVSSPMEDVIAVRLENFAGAIQKGPSFQLFGEPEGFPAEITEEEGSCLLRSGGLSVRIGTRGRWGLEFFWNGQPLTGSSGKAQAYCLDGEGNSHIREQLRLDVGEQIYGLGERFSAFVKNGQSVDIWNADGGTDSEQAYKNIPFYLSSRGYGVFVNDPGRVSFEIASERITAAQFSVPGESMEYFLIGGGSPKEVVSRYIALTGRPPMVPAWTFGLWLTTSFTTRYDEKTVMSFIDGMLDRGIPLTTFHFDCFWMKEFQWCDFLWNSDTFPDPEGMFRRIHQKGVRVCVWINPYIAQKSRLFKEGAEKGYFVKTGDGSVWQWDMWQGGMALVDFTNPDAAEWYKGYLRQLVNMGVDSFKTDFGERIPVQDAFYGPRAARYGIRYFDGSDPDRMHNYYTLLYNRAVYEVLQEAYGAEGACLFARSATVGGQQYPVHWGGDNLANYPSMAQSLRGG